MSVETLDRLGEVLKGNGATLALKWRGDGWYVTEYDTDGLVGLWPPAATLGEAVGAYLEAKTPVIRLTLPEPPSANRGPS